MTSVDYNLARFVALIIIYIITKVSALVNNEINTSVTMIKDAVHMTSEGHGSCEVKRLPLVV